MANEKRLIDANAFKSFLCKCCNILRSDEPCEPNDCNVWAVIDEQPTVDAVEVVHGRWERCGGDLHSSGYAIFCSVCNKTHFVHRRYSLGGLADNELFETPKYCPSCGAVMEVEE